MITKNVREDTNTSFKDIWRHHPELQNWSSSSWWFFLLLPKQDAGYGPKQMMFSYASRVGSEIKVNTTWQKGIDPKRDLGKKEQFMTTVVGWIHDGKDVHEEIIHQPALATLSYDDQSLSAWGGEDNQYGATLQGTMNQDNYSIHANFVGKDGFAIFKIWNPGSHEIENPVIIDVRGPKHGGVGGTNLVAWRRFHFEGDFKSPTGEEHLEGVGYFQRVLMNVPMFPWKWPFVVFEDGSIFSSFIAYLGFHSLRRSYKFFRRIFERMAKPLSPTAYFFNAQTQETTYFETAQIYPETSNKDRPNFYVHTKASNGDFLKLYFESHGHAQFLLDRRIFKRKWQTMYNYNEFMIKLVKSKGSLRGKPFDMSKHGNCWGNIEYTWGMSL